MRLSSATASLLAFARGTPRKAGDKQKRGPFFFHTLLFFSLALLASFIKFLLVPLASSTHAFPTGTAPPRNRPHYHGFAPQSDGVLIPITRLFIIFFSFLSLSRMSFFFVVFIPLPPGCLFFFFSFSFSWLVVCWPGNDHLFRFKDDFILWYAFPTGTAPPQNRPTPPFWPLLWPHSR